MCFSFNRTYYAIVGPGQEVISPFKADHNGLYERETMALKYLAQKVEEAQAYSKGNSDNHQNWANRLEQLRQFKVVPIHVALGEA